MKFAICNLGCKVNNYEANWYSQQLSKKYDEVDFKEFADIYVISSCTVTNMAGSKSRQMIRRARKLNPNAIIAAVSCYVQIEKDNDALQDCQILIGSKDKRRLPELIEQYLQTGEKINIVEPFEKTDFEMMYIEDFNQTRAYLKIQDGCNQFCSYCVIPYARGRERCATADEVIKQARKLVESGHIEIVLTGIHTGRWHDGDLTLTDLIERMLNEIDGLARVRLSSIEMTEVTDQLIELMKRDTRVARHLHIPLQTGTDRMLKLNNRPYTTEDYYNRIQYIKSQIPQVSISSDVIAGLPTETDEEAIMTEQFIDKCKLSFLHVFPYAKKEHTPDAKLPQVNETVKKDRAASLTNLSNQLYNDYMKDYIGKTVDVIFETYHNGVLKGHCSEYVVVEVKSSTDLSKTMQKVYIDAVKTKGFIGHIVQE